MAIIYDREPGVRVAWERFERNRRIARHAETDEHQALLAVVLATLAFWLIAGFGLYMAL